MSEWNKLMVGLSGTAILGGRRVGIGCQVKSCVQWTGLMFRTRIVSGAVQIYSEFLLGLR
jgi:hypothetical protein